MKLVIIPLNINYIIIYSSSRLVVANKVIAVTVLFLAISVTCYWSITDSYLLSWLISSKTSHFFIGYSSRVSSGCGCNSRVGVSGTCYCPLLWSVLHGNVINGVGYQVILFSDAV